MSRSLSSARPLGAGPLGSRALLAPRRPPRAPQHPQPIAEAQLLDQRLFKAALAHRLHQILQACGIAEFGRDHGPVEIGAEADAVFAGMFEHVLDMLDDQLRRRVLVVTAVRTKEARGE